MQHSCTSRTLLITIYLSFRRLRCPSAGPFPYTTLFRSRGDVDAAPGRRRRAEGHRRRAGDVDAGPETSTQDGGHRRSEEHTSELQSRQYLVCRLLLEKKKKTK